MSARRACQDIRYSVADTPFYEGAGPPQVWARWRLVVADTAHGLKNRQPLEDKDLPLEYCDGPVPQRKSGLETSGQW